MVYIKSEHKQQNSRCWCWECIHAFREDSQTCTVTLAHLIFPKDVLNKTEEITVQSIPWLGHGPHNRRVLVRWTILYSSPNRQPAIAPSQPPILWRYSSRGVQLFTNPHQVPRLRMDYVVPPLPHTPTWHAQRLQFTLPPNKIFKSHMARQSTLC
jgi:hypothetical protein